ncbi:BMP family ABC transporter substrate-binding protein [Candidatus Poribacteria bacterium]|nr:BMP family ABC transporter substrate-binding protein [Candidatus Poribacteria bacterium]MYH82405.1 BMP family ABC transporter substrate-binding protein [Candidatus Poribacteria bacterium]MYK95764.1 BMP family ABC transporter substrate-binding protein [Candidatus Poribacteria bacterium]
MKNFNIFGKYLFFGFILLFISGCSAVQDVILSEPRSEMDAAPLRVTMIYPSDCVGSAAYCDAFHTGVRTAEGALGITLTEVNGIENDPVATEVLLRDAAQNSELVLTAGYQMGEVLVRVAPEFPDVSFAIFDVVLDIPNVASVNYKSNEGSFLVGAIAALKSESNKIGYIGGADVSLLQEFEAGYVAGIHTINPEAEVTVEYISKDATGFGQPEKAKELALAQYASGVDVIYVAAGGSGQGVLEAAQAEQKFIIWVDSNGNHLAPGLVLTSMTKEIPVSVQRIIRETADRNFMAGIRYFGLKDGGVSYAVDEHNQPLLSDDIVETVESLKAKIIAGEIVVPDTVSLPRE